jgi:hypothetical protein
VLDLINIDDIVEDFTDGQLLVATHRAALELGYKHELNADGSIDTDALAEAIVDRDIDEFSAAFEWQLKLMAGAQMFAAMLVAGEVYEDGVDEHGELIYRAVPQI